MLIDQCCLWHLPLICGDHTVKDPISTLSNAECGDAVKLKLEPGQLPVRTTDKSHFYMCKSFSLSVSELSAHRSQPDVGYREMFCPAVESAPCDGLYCKLHIANCLAAQQMLFGV